MPDDTDMGKPQNHKIFFSVTKKQGKGIYFLPIRLQDKNLLTEDKANPVIGPVVSSERITSKNGLRKTLASSSSRSVIVFRTSFNWEKLPSS